MRSLARIVSAVPAVSALLVGALLALTGCGGANTASPDPLDTGTVAAGQASRLSGSYVALGDSYSAAPGVATVDIAAGCLRSDHNYPHLIAAAQPGIELTDVTCSAATTAALSAPQRTAPALGLSVPPQLDALTPSTRYVTLGIGGNDVGLFNALVGCMTRGGCQAAYGAKADAMIDTIGKHVARALRAIHAQAPAARVALVGYPQLVPASGTCTALPLDAADASFVHDVLVKLSDRMAAAADHAGARFVDVLSASAGHDICAPEPWVNGPRGNGGAAAFHPFLAEQRAVAGLVADAFS